MKAFRITPFLIWNFLMLSGNYNLIQAKTYPASQATLQDRLEGVWFRKSRQLFDIGGQLLGRVCPHAGKYRDRWRPEKWPNDQTPLMGQRWHYPNCFATTSRGHNGGRTKIHVLVSIVLAGCRFLQTVLRLYQLSTFWFALICSSASNNECLPVNKNVSNVFSTLTALFQNST